MNKQNRLKKFIKGFLLLLLVLFIGTGITYLDWAIGIFFIAFGSIFAFAYSILEV